MLNRRDPAELQVLEFEEEAFNLILGFDPKLATEYAILLVARKNELNIEAAEYVANALQARGSVQNLTSFAIEALKGDLIGHESLQTKVLELNLSFFPQVR